MLDSEIKSELKIKTEYKFIRFKWVEDKPKTSVWLCLNNNSDSGLGVVRWETRWRQYCYFPLGTTLYSAGCLNDIADFINQLKAERKK